MRLPFRQLFAKTKQVYGEAFCGFLLIELPTGITSFFTVIFSNIHF